MKCLKVVFLVFVGMLLAPRAEASVLMLPGRQCIEDVEVLSDQNGEVEFSKDNRIYSVKYNRIIDIANNKPSQYRALAPADYPDFIVEQPLAEPDPSASLSAPVPALAPAASATPRTVSVRLQGGLVLTGVVKRQDEKELVLKTDGEEYLIPVNLLQEMVDAGPESQAGPAPSPIPTPAGIDTSRRITIYLQDGRSFTGYARRWDENELVLQTEKGEVLIPASQVVDAVYTSTKKPSRAARYQEQEKGPAFQTGDFILSFQGSIYHYPACQVLDLERSINPIEGWAVYGDGTVKWSEMTHASFLYGGVLEHLVQPNLGLLAGYHYYNVWQKVAVGGGGYEEKVFAEGSILDLNNPCLGVNYYLLNRSQSIYMFVGGRVGASFGNLYPAVTVFDILGSRPVAVGLSGWNLAAGLGFGYLLAVLDMRLSLFYNAEMLHMSERVYTDLGQDFTLGLLEISGSVGVKF